MREEGFIITHLPHKNLGGGAYAMRRFTHYEGSVFWRVHVVYKGYRIMRAYHAENKKPCALYCFRLDEDTLIVRENLAGIKDEASQYAKEGKWSI